MNNVDSETIQTVVAMLENIRNLDSEKVYPDNPGYASAYYTPLQQAKNLAEYALDQLGDNETFGDLTLADY